MKLVEGFDWDQGNRRKCQKHGLSLTTIERFFRGKVQVFFDPRHSSTEERCIAVGRDMRGKPMFVGFTYRKKDGKVLIRPISARYMHLKEAERYEKASSKVQAQ